MHRLLVSLILVLAMNVPAIAADSSAVETVRLWYRTFSTKDPSLIEKFIAPEWVDIPSPPTMPPGPVGLRQLYGQLTAAFPDLQVTIEEILTDGDKVVVRSTLSGTHAATFLNFPVTHRRLSIQAIDIHQVKEGKIIRTWHTEDWLTGLLQLGILKP